ncbi:5128_t:CDS:1, partial [Racocetra fulgida]
TTAPKCDNTNEMSLKKPDTRETMAPKCDNTNEQQLQRDTAPEKQ